MGAIKWNFITWKSLIGYWKLLPSTGQFLFRCYVNKTLFWYWSIWFCYLYIRPFCNIVRTKIGSSTACLRAGFYSFTDLYRLIDIFYFKLVYACLFLNLAILLIYLFIFNYFFRHNSLKTNQLFCLTMNWMLKILQMTIMMMMMTMMLKGTLWISS